MSSQSKTIFFYVIREYLLSFLIAFSFFFFIFFINQILLMAEEILSKNVPFWDVVRLIVYSFPAIISFSFPFGSLVGALMAIGRLSADNEILAMQSCGIHHMHIFLPMFFLGICFSLVSFITTDIFLPLGTINFGKLYREVLFSNPQLELEPYSIKHYQDSIMITGDVNDRIINDLVIIDRTHEKDRRIILADRAVLSQDEEQHGVTSLELSDVFSQVIDKNKKNMFEYSKAGRMVYNILLKDISFSLQNPGPREMSSVDVYNAIQEKRRQLEIRKDEQKQLVTNLRFALAQQYAYLTEMTAERRNPPRSSDVERLNGVLAEYERQSNKTINDRSLQIYLLEFYKKFSIPLGCLAFVIFAFPVGYFARRSGRSIGFGIGLIVSILYWSLLFAGQTLGLRLDFPPFWSMWLPNILIVALGLSFFVIGFKR